MIKSLKNGMQVEVIANENGGNFPIGTVGTIRGLKIHDWGYLCKVVVKGKWWLYHGEELRAIKKDKIPKIPVVKYCAFDYGGGI